MLVYEVVASDELGRRVGWYRRRCWFVAGLTCTFAAVAVMAVLVAVKSDWLRMPSRTTCTDLPPATILEITTASGDPMASCEELSRSGYCSDAISRVGCALSCSACTAGSVRPTTELNASCADPGRLPSAAQEAARVLAAWDLAALGCVSSWCPIARSEHKIVYATEDSPIVLKRVVMETVLDDGTVLDDLGEESASVQLLCRLAARQRLADRIPWTGEPFTTAGAAAATEGSERADGSTPLMDSEVPGGVRLLPQQRLRGAPIWLTQAAHLYHEIAGGQLGRSPAASTAAAIDFLRWEQLLVRASI